MEEVVSRLKKLDALHVPINVEEYNVNFYEKCGFKKTSQVYMSMNI